MQVCAPLAFQDMEVWGRVLALRVCTLSGARVALASCPLVLFPGRDEQRDPPPRPSLLRGEFSPFSSDLTCLGAWGGI